MIVTIEITADASAAAVRDIPDEQVKWLVALAKELNSVGRSYAAHMHVYQGNVLHEHNRWNWETCDLYEDGTCYNTGEIDYNLDLYDFARLK